MYISTFTSLDTALSGVEAAQEELATTGNNIANENTTDYEEQSVNLTETVPLTIADGNSADEVQLGTGVDAAGVANASNQYLDAAYRNQNAVSSGATTADTYTTQMQSLLGEDNEDDGAISSELSSFWTDWSSLSSNPTNSGAKQAVVSSGEELADSVNTLSTSITALQGQAASQYENITEDQSGGEIYDDVTQLVSLNASIKQATEGGYSDNTLLDQRNGVLDDLSSLATTTVTDNSDGTVNVSFGGVSNLVQGTTVNWPSSDPNGVTLGTGDFTFPSGATGASIGGTLGALVSFAGTGGTAQTTLSELDGVANTLATSVNALTADSTSGQTSFFSITSGGAAGSAAASLAVTSDLISDPSEVPITATSNSGANDIALAVSQLSGGAADTAYDSFVESVGGVAQQASDDDTTQSTLLTQIQDQKTSVEGVDNNTEMSNLIEEQQAYEASAKVMSTFSTMMDSLMEVVGQ